MKLLYLTVPKEEENRVLAHGAWFDRNAGMYAITKYQDEKDFAGLLNGRTAEWDHVSISVACRCMGLDRPAAQQYLIQEGYLNEQKLPTEKGALAGIRIKTAANGAGKVGSYCVYPDAFLDEVLWPQRRILAKDSVSLRRDQRIPRFYACAPSGSCSHYPKLLIPDTAVCLAAAYADVTKDGGKVTGLACVSAGTDESGTHPVLLDIRLQDTSGEDAAAAYQQLLAAIQGHTILGYNLPLLRRLLPGAAAACGADAASLSLCFSTAADCIDVARTYLASSDYRLPALLSLVGIAAPEAPSPVQECQCILSLFDALEARPFVPLSEALTPAVPAPDAAETGEVLEALRKGAGIDTVVGMTGIPQHLAEQIFLAALRQRRADPQWVMTLAREQELFTFIKQHPAWTGTAGSLKRLAGSSFAPFEVETALSDWRFVKSLERIGRTVRQ